ncbi:MAG: hypothetical protein KJ906_00665 [Nanoarchaeota archaeon]|nr:hypothetical protein [Nanoarchaeota archaeon]
MQNLIKNAPELKELVTFVPNKIEPIHNWYYYKEGFSKKFVEWCIDKFGITNKHVVLDQFCGVGTTPLTCKQHGIKSIGFDCSPLCTFVSRVKTTDYDLEELEEVKNEVLSWSPEKSDVPNNNWLKIAFNKKVLEDIISYKKRLFSMKNEDTRNFMILALMNASMMSSYVEKDGAFLKVKKKHVPPLKKAFDYSVKKMFKEYSKSNIPNTEVRIDVCDARDLDLKDKSVDFIITSPPYLNKIEYTQIYRTEYALFFDQPKTRIHSAIENEEEHYFNDMRKVIEEMKRVCKGKVAVVIGGGCFPDRVVEVDRSFARLAEQVGWKVDDILVARNSWCTRSKVMKVARMRESVILLSSE